MSVTDKNELKQLEGKGLHIPAPPGAESEDTVYQPPSDEIYTGQEFKTASSGQEEKKENIAKDITILVMITLVSGLLLGLAYSITKAPIAAAKESARAAAQRAVMSSAEAFEMKYSTDEGGAEAIPEALADALADAGILTTEVTEIDIAYDGSGDPAGYVVTAVNPDGYGGDVELMCGVTPGEDGSMTIEGISFLSLSETAGMGMRAKDEAFISQFSGRKIAAGGQVVYTKNGASKEYEIDAISGCTITTSAVTDDVNAALTAAGLMMQEEAE